ncbi:MAG TPA: TonB-dependent receptor [Chitinophagaceae bacterium]|nr:TonB-dependent receptor [Chitinophagaceae bacterium]
MQQRVFILSLFFLIIHVPFSGICQDTTKTTNQNKLRSTNRSHSQPGKHSLHGTIKAKGTGEVIIGATVSVTGYSTGTVSNEYGFYSLTLPQDDYTLEISAVGMTSQQIKVSLNKDVKLDILLEEEVTNLQEVTVKASSTGRSLKNPQMGVEKINVHEVRTIPVLFGERDILKTIQLLPGIKSAEEGNSGFYARGGSADQNLILLDEAPVYNASHLLGFFSTFNSDAIKNVTLYKGTMPAQYGGRLSSVLDIKMNDGNNQDFAVSGGIGLIASRLNIEGPLQKDKSSFLVSARRTYADVFLKLGDSSLKKTKLYFYDLNTKMNFILGEKDKIFLSGYFGRDVLSQDKVAGINWGNATGTLRWNHIFNKKLFSNTSLIYSNYDYKIDVHTESTDYGILSRIRDWNLKEELQLYANANNTVIFGVNSIYHTIKPGEISVTGNTGTVTQGLQDRYSLDNAIYANNSWRINNKWNLTYGLRISAFTVLGEGDYYTLDDNGKVIDTTHYGPGEIVKTYLNAEPRVAASYQLNPISSLKASYTRNTQNLHLINNSVSSSPTDKWVASTNIIKPEIADQVAIGYYRDLKDRKYEINVETYYKTMQNQIDYRDGAEVFTNEAIETQLLYGKGRAYGIEWLFRKKTGRLTGWISYTLSKTERKIDGINNNQWYNARQDRTHDIAIVAMYQLNEKWTLSANWIFYTGDAVTYPSGKYTVDNEVYFYYSERNGYRMPNYHRLDIGATKQLTRGKRFSSELNFSVYNAYGRANAYQVSFRESETDPDKTEAVKTSLFTFVPSISYNFKF